MGNTDKGNHGNGTKAGINVFTPQGNNHAPKHHHPSKAAQREWRNRYNKSHPHGSNGPIADVVTKAVKADSSNNDRKANQRAHQRAAQQRQNKGANRPGAGKKGGGRRGGGGGGMNFSQGNMNYTGFGAPPHVSRTLADTMVTRDINQQMNAILNQIKGQKNASQYDINKINALFDRTKGDLNYVYNEAGDSIGAQNKKIDDRFGATAAQNAQQFQNFQNAAAQQVSQNHDAALAEMQRLGVQGVGLDRFNADAANNASVANQTNANNEANLAAMKSGADEVGSMLGSMTEASRASALGRAVNSRADNISDTKQKYLDYYNQQLNRINDVRAGKANEVEKLYEAQNSTAFQQWMDSNQANFNNNLAASNFNLNVSQLNSQNYWQKAKLAQQKAEAAQQRRLKAQQMAAYNAYGAVNNTVNSLGNIFGFGS